MFRWAFAAGLHIIAGGGTNRIGILHTRHYLVNCGAISTARLEEPTIITETNATFK
jgi:hypothetical protein